MEIKHLHILVKDVEVSRTFYMDTFDMSESLKADFGYLMQDDAGMDFVIGPIENDEPAGQRMHFGFRQESKEKVKEKFEQLTNKGQAFQTPYVELDSITLFSVNDPDDNLIEVYFIDQ